MQREQLAHLSPPDAVVALRSYVRRFGDALRPADLAGDVPLTRAVHDGWSVRDLLAATAEHLDGLDRGIRRGLDDDRPVLTPGLLDRPAAPPAAGRPSDRASDRAGTDVAVETAQLLDAVRATFERSAERTARTPSKDWSRPVVIGTTGSTVHELLRELVAYGRTARTAAVRMTNE